MKPSAPRRCEANPRAGSKTLLIALLLALSVLASPTWAAMVTTQKSGLEDIFSMDTFGSDTIRFEFNPVETLVAAHLLDIDTGAEFSELKGYYSSPATLAINIIRLFFVDTLTCNGGSAVGCAEIGGNDIVVNSTTAASTNLGSVLLAHEIGHNLNLSHDSAKNAMGDLIAGNVMRPTLNTANVNFLPAQILTIFDSPLVQSDEAGYFINITPILVSAAHVPIPGAIVLFFGAIASLGIFGRKNREPNVPA